MIQDIFPNKYHVEYQNVSPREQDHVFIFCGSRRREQKVLIHQDSKGQLSIPTIGQVTQAGAELQNLEYLFSIETDADHSEDRFFLLMRFEEEVQALHINGYDYEPLGVLRSCKPKELCFAGMTAFQLYDWYRISRFCGCCGNPMVPFGKERAMRCPSCGNLVFPKICPAVIVGVIWPYLDEKGNRCREKDRIVVTRYAGREYKGIALIAGFCEIGETPEDTVRREVLEEVGLHVKNIRYYKSQPWGFDSNLLLGYFCEVDGDTVITRDKNELATAEWAQRNSMENTRENLLALTGTMIDAFMRDAEE